MKKHSEYALLGLKALERAASKVAENARRNNYKICLQKLLKYHLKEIEKDFF